MANEYIIILYYVVWGLLVFTVISFFISGLDDLFIDIFYWILYLRHLWILRKAKPLTYEKLNKLLQKRIAVLIPCWHEAGVIEEMLRYNIYAMDYENYDIFVGLYPNDPLTVKSVEEVAKSIEHVHIAINLQEGPTTKADNLNNIYNYVLEYEKKYNVKYELFVMHDSEDVIHYLSFKFYNYLMPKNHMVQTPIFPLAVPLKDFTHWCYAAEFAEIHTKDILVRENIGGFVPSAGVGTAFTRGCLDILKAKRGGKPFSLNTLTEDYSTALEIKRIGLKAIFASQYVYRTAWVKRFYFFGPTVLKRIREYIATRALFPMTYMKSVRQKTRWILGISFQEWVNTGWGGNFATFYTLLHDRKSIFTHLVTGLFLILIPFWLLYQYLTIDSPQYPTLQDMFEDHYWVWVLIVISSMFMINRIFQRAIAVFRVYGIIPAIWGIPLILYTNIINLHSLLRAYFIFFFTPKTKSGAPKWDKTDHSFPVQNPLIPYKYKLGDLLIKKKLITSEQLAYAVTLQNRTGKKLGDTLIDLGYMNQHQLNGILAEQYGLKQVNHVELSPLSLNAIPYISKYHYDLLKRASAVPFKVEDDIITMAIQDPSDDIKIARIIRWMKPYKVKFVLEI